MYLTLHINVAAAEAQLLLVAAEIPLLLTAAFLPPADGALHCLGCSLPFGPGLLEEGFPLREEAERG